MNEYEEEELPEIHSLWQGIYDFPGRPANIIPWLLVTFNLSGLAMIAWGFKALFATMKQDFGGFEGLMVMGLSRVFAFLCVFSIVFSFYVATTFSRVVEDTAAGRDEVGWPKEPWLDFLSKWSFLLWLIGCALTISVFFTEFWTLLIPQLQPYWAGLAIAGVWFVFPIFLLCTMSAGSPWWLLEIKALSKLGARPQVTAFLFLNCLLLLAPCLVAGYFMVAREYIWLAPIVGFVWSWAILSHARVIGRVGWALTNEVAERPKRKKRRSRKK